MKRLYVLTLLPGFSGALFMIGLLRRQGLAVAGLPAWLAAGALIAVLMAGVWLAHWLQRRPALLAALRARPYVVLATIAGLGLVLRLSLIAGNRFYGDEALYAHWGLLIATGKDVFLKTEIVDKPPLFFYTLAAFFRLLGPSEVVARLPSIIASISGIAIVYALARGLYGRRTATLAALFLALSPFDILFAPTAFTDSMMVALALGSCLAALKGRYPAAGLLLGLAALTKPTAVFFLPLVAFLGAAALNGARWKLQTKRAGLGLGSGLAAVVVLGAVWDRALRPGSPSVLDAGSVHYGGMKLVPLAGLLPHLAEWMGQLQYLTDSRPLDVFLLVGVLALLLYGLWQRERRPGWAYDLGLAGFALLFMAAHTVLSFSAWDRYLLGLAPILAILLARVALLPIDLVPGGDAAAWRGPVYASLLAVFLTLAMLPPLQAALAGSLPVGGDHGKFTGIDEVAAYFRGNVVPGAAVFHHDEGWHYSYYMFGYPYSFCYYPDVAYMLDYVRRLPPDQAKYVALPDWVDSAGLQATLQTGGWGLRDVYRTYRADGTLSFTVYRIEPQGK